MASDEASTAIPSGRFAKGQLKPAAPLPKMPSRWALELQKAAFLLSQENETKSGSLVVAFSGMQKGGGVTTISYLIAHYLAAEKPDLRVLYVDFSMDRKRPSRQGIDGLFKIGQAVTNDVFLADPKSFTKFAIRPSDDNGTTMHCSRWLRDFMETARRHCDWIIVDVPPFSTTPESYTLAQFCDGVVLLLKSGESRYPALNRLVADLEQVGIRVLGTIMNFRQYPIPSWLLKYL